MLIMCMCVRMCAYVCVCVPIQGLCSSGVGVVSLWYDSLFSEQVGVTWGLSHSCMYASIICFLLKPKPLVKGGSVGERIRRRRGGGMEEGKGKTWWQRVPVRAGQSASKSGGLNKW